MFKSVLKAVLIVVGLAVVVQALPAYYRSNEFDYYLQRETTSARTETHLKQEVLTKAREYSLPVREENITISMSGRSYRVAVNYSVPINLLLFSHDLRFHSLGGGWLPKTRDQ